MVRRAAFWLKLLDAMMCGISRNRREENGNFEFVSNVGLRKRKFPFSLSRSPLSLLLLAVEALVL
uniref:Uncharacterized protein n=1 Tax=Nelumbo nucifera TaxID=4432 RepID=A0A822YSB4_NELNU|nr:TPA_asm: hypothetical protein HUJ06_005643 [Nelumbo nucifera]